MSQGRAAANNSKCLNNLRSLGIASKLYTMEDSRQTNPSMTTWHDELLRYLEYPEDVTTLIDLQKLPPETAQNMALWCPALNFNEADSIVQRDRSCYGINMSYFASGHNNNPDKRITAFDVGADAAEIIAFLDATSRNVFHSTPSRIGTGRHGDNVNVVFVDGHVESVPYNGTETELDPEWRKMFDGPNR
ncbi:hypothetical protein SH580_03545 [Coraliomargarita algicola]|uniref:Uncharacterized protein n=1 Tax=Coraliomargarita algicola TaxID=3092156 RepID=A0ABZ0RKN6_9BACT|nr:hypothetical protein [Coraliomargarita sp. J2-16]WPJ96779.1 hypothetical protein SH580_03545 [Coraliomargarita sp. J2-16]